MKSRHQAIAIILSGDEVRLAQSLFLNRLAWLVDKFEPAHLVVNFERVEGLCAGELGALVAAQNKLEANGGRLSLVNVGPLAMEVIRVAHLDRVLEINALETPALEQVA